MRNLYLVAYDIADAKRLRHMHRVMEGFGDPLQYSLFRCLLSQKERLLLIDASLSVMNQKEDRVMVINLGPERGNSGDRVEFLGVREEFEDKRAIIV